MERYDPDQRAAINAILNKSYIGILEREPREFSPTHRVSKILHLINLEPLGGTKVFSEDHPTKIPCIQTTEEDFKKRMDEQIETYLSLQLEKRSSEWKTFGKRNLESIQQYLLNK